MLNRLIRKLVRSARPRPQRDPNFIDVQRLIHELSDEDLLRSADDYFAKMSLASEQCRKPFSNPAGATHQTRHLGLLFEAADLFRGARVLDFGCATGWLTVGLAQMGCDAVGVDISPNALKLAEGLKAARPKAHGAGPIEFLAYDGHRLPLPDASVDRIVCFDAFHHVRDQRATIAEFARVLKRGGRAAFMEPGPNHSKTPQSQAEMAQFKVIENDVRMEDIARHALDAGMDRPMMLLQFPQPLTVGVDDFNAWARDGIALRWSWRAIDTLRRGLTNGQCFYILKGDPVEADRDSRRAEGLAAEITVQRAARVAAGAGHGIELQVAVRNNGTRAWIAAAMPGQVNLGVHLLDGNGRLLDNSYARLKLPRGPVEPGEQVLISGTMHWPGLESFALRLDMVAELVAWFSERGPTQRVTIASRDL
ncbi:MAG TPA: methyltransferase domain-containing protein [Burkholderiaceae bacterium]